MSLGTGSNPPIIDGGIHMPFHDDDEKRRWHVRTICSHMFFHVSLSSHSDSLRSETYAHIIMCVIVMFLFTYVHPSVYVHLCVFCYYIHPCICIIRSLLPLDVTSTRSLNNNIKRFSVRRFYIRIIINITLTSIIILTIITI